MDVLGRVLNFVFFFLEVGSGGFLVVGGVVFGEKWRDDLVLDSEMHCEGLEGMQENLKF